LSFICPEGYPTGSICLPWIVSPKRIGRAALNDPIRGISACKVYPLPELPPTVVSSYLTFSPLPAKGWLLFSVALSVPRLREDPAVHRCIALCCPDFPTLPEKDR